MSPSEAIDFYSSFCRWLTAGITIVILATIVIHDMWVKHKSDEAKKCPKTPDQATGTPAA